MEILKTKRLGGDACLVAAVLLLAFLIRWVPALVPHFWYDEIYTVAITNCPFLEILRVTAADAHPPLYYFWVKLFAAAGRRLGGLFATLAWLRLASILPGMLTCVLAWGLARHCWGRRPVLWMLGLFAVSPALTYYSVELRNYSLVQCLLLAGLACLLGALGPEPRRRRQASILFALVMILALYVHSLAVLYLAAMGVIFLAEWALRHLERQCLMQRAMVALVPLALCYLPWVPIVHHQNAWVTQANRTWLPWAGWPDLISTFLWYLPLGPFNIDQQGLRWPWAVMVLVGVGFLGLLVMAVRRPATGTLPSAGRGRPPLPIFHDRLLCYSAALIVIPILEAFTLSHFQLARVFLGHRYNLIAAPFFTLALAGLTLRLPRSAWRRGVLIGMLAVGAGLSGLLLFQRTRIMNDLQHLATGKDSSLTRPGTRIYWTDPTVLPWLGRCGNFTIASPDEALTRAPADPGTGDSYFYSLSILSQNRAFSMPRTKLLERLLERRKTAQIDTTGQWDTSSVCWRLRPDELARLAADLTAVTRTLEARRQAIPGGQVVLADDPAFRDSLGWSCVDFDTAFAPECWTEGPRQELTWFGPEQPGRYRLQVRFYRANPYPEKIATLRYRLPGQPWRERSDGRGWVILEEVITIARSRQPLTLELQTQTWIPAERLPGSTDPRPLGMLFTGIELHPVKK